jgi:hypothetical protein
VYKQPTTVPFGYSNIFVKVYNIQKSFLLWDWKSNPRQLPPLEKRIHQGANNPSKHNFSVTAQGKRLGTWLILRMNGRMVQK